MVPSCSSLLIRRNSAAIVESESTFAALGLLDVGGGESETVKASMSRAEVLGLDANDGESCVVYRHRICARALELARASWRVHLCRRGPYNEWR
jgi:hypothetical protein